MTFAIVSVRSGHVVNVVSTAGLKMVPTLGFSVFDPRVSG